MSIEPTVPAAAPVAGLGLRRWIMAVGALFAISAVALYQVEQAGQERLEASLSAVHRATMRDLASFRTTMVVSQQTWMAHPQVVRAAEALVTTPSQDLVSSPAQASLRELLSGPMRIHQYEGYFLIAPSGVSIASSRDGNLGSPNLLLAQPDLLERAWAGETLLTRPQPSDVPLPGPDGEPVLARATMFSLGPVRDESGAIIAVFAFRVNPSVAFQRVLDDGSYLDSGWSYAVDADGWVRSGMSLHTSDAAVVAPGAVAAVLPPGVGSLDDLGETWVAPSAYVNLRDDSVYGVWGWDDAMGLAVVTEVGRAEAGTLARSARLTVLSMGLACLALLAGLALALRRQERVVAEARRAHHEQEVAEGLVKAKGAFLAQMSHEIRTPLNGVLGMLEVLSDSPLDADQRDAVELANRSGRNLLRIINDILDFSRADSGRIELDPIPVNLRTLCADTVRVLAVEASRRNTRLAVVIDPEVPNQVVVDPERLAQVITNLIGNAVKFTEDGKVTLSVGLEARTPTHAEVCIAVQDTGVGIAPERLGAIFEEFLQASAGTSRRYGGTGLGLAICTRLVKAMGGEMKVESTLGEGSRFYFSLRLAIGAAPHLRVVTGEERPLEHARVLVVDDTPAAVAVQTAALESVGARVVSASNGFEALELIDGACDARTPFDLVVLDGQMPGMDGFELSRAIRERERCGGMPLLMLSSSLEVGGTARARRSGIDGFVMKPVPRDALLQLCRAVMSRSLGQGEPIITRRAVMGGGVAGTVLVVDDNAVNRAVASTLLKRAGHMVIEASSGVAALERLHTHRVDLVLMDVEMPEMDGLQATARIRAEPGFAHLPVIGLTAHALGEQRDACIAAGMNDVLTKPVRSDDLNALLDAWIRATGAFPVETAPLGERDRG